MTTSWSVASTMAPDAAGLAPRARDEFDPTWPATPIRLRGAATLRSFRPAAMVLSRAHRAVLVALACLIGSMAPAAAFGAPGDLDGSFTLGANGPVRVAVEDSDGSILIGGEFTEVGGVTRHSIARINADGTLDMGFDPNVRHTTLTAAVHAIAVQANGKILIGGNFETVGGVGDPYISRLNADGTRDSGFISPDPGRTVRAVAVQSSGRILIGGEFENFGVTGYRYLARLQSNGQLDLTFAGGPDPPANPGYWVRAITVLPDATFLIGGDFQSVGGVTRRHLARLSENGALQALDLGINSGGIVHAVKRLSDGKILLGGEFTTVATVLRWRLARLNANLTHDTTFANTSIVSTVRAVATQSDGSIIAVGDFGSVGAATRNRVALFSPTGTLDPDFNPNADSRVSTVAVLADHRILLGGEFANVSSTARSRLAIIDGVRPPGAPTGVAVTAGDGQAVVTWTAPAANGGSAITGYTVTASPGGRQCSWTSGPLTCTVTSLANGTAYSFTVTATSAAGTGAASAASAATPSTVPGAPTGVTGTTGEDGRSVVSWTAPAQTGGAAITAYTVTATPGGRQCTWTSGPLTCAVTGLANGTAYTFAVTATNASGTGAASAASGAITPAAAPVGSGGSGAADTGAGGSGTGGSGAGGSGASAATTERGAPTAPARVAWPKPAKGKPVRATFTAESGTTYTIRATLGTKKATGRCTTAKGQAACTIALKARGRWTVTITPKRGGVTGTPVTRVVRV